MDSDRLNRWLTLGANLGVLVGIILLVIELDQNREATRAQTRHDLSMAVIESMKPMIENAEFASIHRRGAAGEELTDDEAWQLRFHYMGLIRYWENAYFQYQIGTYDEDKYLLHLESMSAILDDPFASNVWCEYRDRISPDFRSELDLRFDASGC